MDCRCEKNDYRIKENAGFLGIRRFLHLGASACRVPKLAARGNEIQKNRGTMVFRGESEAFLQRTGLLRFSAFYGPGAALP